MSASLWFDAGKLDGGNGMTMLPISVVQRTGQFVRLVLRGRYSPRRLAAEATDLS
jgi:hypothetical protein